MLPFFVIPIVSQATQVASGTVPFFSQSIDVIMYDILIWFGWIPIAITLAWGFVQMWLNYRRGIFVGKLKFMVLAIDVPTATEQSPKAVENLFASLYAAKSSITWKEKWIGGRLHPSFSFEIISTEGYIQFLVRTQTRFRDVIEAGVYAHYPDAEISEVEDYAKKFPNDFPNDQYEMWGTELTFEKPSMYPIRTYVDFEDRMTQEIKDPLGLTLEQFAKMRPGEHMWFQIIVQPSDNKWQAVSVKYVRKIYGDEDKAKKSGFLAFLDSTLSWPAEFLAHTTGIDLSALLGTAEVKKEDDPWKAFKITLPQKDEAEAILTKATKVGLGVKIRVVYVAEKNAFVKIERTAIVKGLLHAYSHLNFNRFELYTPSVPKDDYFWMRWVYTKKQHRLMQGYQGRSWGIGASNIWLNVEELATLWHFPTITMRAPLVKKSESKRGEPPVGLPITYLEETLPGFGTEQEDEPILPFAPDEEYTDSDEIPPGLAFSSLSGETYEDDAPHPSAPTQERPEEDSSEASSDDEPAQIDSVSDPFEGLVEPTTNRQLSGDDLEDDIPPNLPI